MFNRGYIKKILKKQKTPNYIDVMKREQYTDERDRIYILLYIDNYDLQ